MIQASKLWRTVLKRLQICQNSNLAFLVHSFSQLAQLFSVNALKGSSLPILAAVRPSGGHVFCLLSSSPPSLSTPSPSSPPSPPSSLPLSPSPPPSLSSYPPILTVLQPSGGFVFRHYHSLLVFVWYQQCGFWLDLVHFDITHTGRCILKHQSSIEASWRQFQRRWGENISADKNFRLKRLRRFKRRKIAEAWTDFYGNLCPDNCPRAAPCVILIPEKSW